MGMENEKLKRIMIILQTLNNYNSFEIGMDFFICNMQ